MASSTAPHQQLTEDQRRQKALEDYRKKLIEHRELDAKLKKSKSFEKKNLLAKIRTLVWKSRPFAWRGMVWEHCYIKLVPLCL